LSFARFLQTIFIDAMFHKINLYVQSTVKGYLVTNARNIKKCVLWSVVITVILILTMGAAYSGDVELKTEGNVTGEAFDYLQQQIYDLQQQIDDLQQQINTIELTPGPAGTEGPKGHSGPAGADGAQGPASPKGLVLTVH